MMIDIYAVSMRYAAVIIITYILGSIPFGLIIGRLTTKTDIRQTGSGRIGATNVLRTAGKKAAALSLILDIAKGAMAVLIARWLFGGDHPAGADASLLWMSRTAQAMAALAVMAGHNWSVFLKFKGGRGVATFLGGLLALAWPAAIFGGLVMILVAGTSRYMSLGSISGAIAAFIILIPLNIWDIYPLQYLIFAVLGALFITVMHRDNISRLQAGTERKLGEKAETKGSASPGDLK